MADENKKIKKKPTKKLIYLASCGAGIFIGVVMLIVYIISMNMWLAVLGVLLAGPGALGFWYFWKYEGVLIEKDIHQKKYDEAANTLCIYAHDAVMRHLENPPGHLIEFPNFGEKLHIARFEGEYENNNNSEPQSFRLPDRTSIMSAWEFASVVRNHKEVKELIKVLKKNSDRRKLIKTSLLVITIAVLWILILTTT